MLVEQRNNALQLGVVLIALVTRRFHTKRDSTCIVRPIHLCCKLCIAQILGMLANKSKAELRSSPRNDFNLTCLTCRLVQMEPDPGICAEMLINYLRLVTWIVRGTFLCHSCCSWPRYRWGGMVMDLGDSAPFIRMIWALCYLLLGILEHSLARASDIHWVSLLRVTSFYVVALLLLY